MSMAGAFAKGVGSLFRGLLLGILFVILVIAGFIVLSSIVSAEAPDIEYHTGVELDTPTYILRDLEATIVDLEVAVEMLDWFDCTGAYETLRYRLAHIRKQIERQPKVAHIYKGVIKVLEEGITELDNSEACGK